MFEKKLWINTKKAFADICAGRYIDTTTGIYKIVSNYPSEVHSKGISEV